MGAGISPAGVGAGRQLVAVGRGLSRRRACVQFVAGQSGVVAVRVSLLLRLHAGLAAHRVVVRAEAGYRVWSAGQVLGYGAVLLLVELMGVLVVLSVLV
ncbi:hypothetical protein ABZ916_36995 [Streptomyces sp. NPDC046853]|uniref:hypothetical protein n=1 Tax=Streptomyces sp. NPDC046853 TaxID=3154920 RepID=UPI003404C56E